MGERWARWGYGYQDKVATERVLDILRKGLREGGIGLEGIRLADLDAGRVDDFVLVWPDSVEGNSIKWSAAAPAITWSDLVGATGLLKELAEGTERLSARWPRRTVNVRFHTNRPASVERHPAQLITSISVSDFLTNHWPSGPDNSDSAEAKDAWQRIAEHVDLSGVELSTFVASCRLSLGQPEPPASAEDSLDWKHYRQQFDSLHKAIATWLTNTPDGDFIDRDYLLTAIGVRPSRSGLIQRFPEPEIPYEKNHTAADQLKALIDTTAGGYLAVLGPAGIGKSTLVQDVLTASAYPFFVPYYAYLPSTDGNRDRGEALTFFQDVIARLDRFHGDRHSLGIADLPQGRDALRRHMTKANERYVLHGHKTILLLDGLDHVMRELSLQEPVLCELPDPAEVPDGFVIILSGQPHALAAGAIPAHVAAAVSESARRLEVSGLSRVEVHTLLSRIAKSTTGNERDALHSACLGNPLILTYLLAQLGTTPETTVEEAIRLAGHYEGRLEKYYRERLAAPLQSSETRRLLGLLCRATPTIPVSWLVEWPEKGGIEEIYQRVLVPFVRIDEGRVEFVHDSLVAFLKAETRSPLPGTDAIGEEKVFHSILADRSSDRPCSDPVGRARILHLARAGRHAEILAQLSSDWLRQATREFIPYAHIHPILLAGFAAACITREWGEVLRLILLSHELEQRTSRLGAAQLADALLDLDQAQVALSQVRSGGRLLVDDDVALRFALSLWWHAHNHDRAELKLAARALYLQAMPIPLIYQREGIESEAHSQKLETLSVWSEVATLFEQPAVIRDEIQSLQFTHRDEVDQPSAATVRAHLLFRSLGTAIDAGRAVKECQVLVDAIETCGSSTWRFLARFRLAESRVAALAPLTEPDDQLHRAYEEAETSSDVDLAYAWFLVVRGFPAEAATIARRLRHILCDFHLEPHDWGFSCVTYTIKLRRLQEVLGIPEGPIPVAKDDREEGSARVARAARQLGYLQAVASKGAAGAQEAAVFRSLLLFHNHPVHFDTLGGPLHDVSMTSRNSIYRELVRLAEAMGPGALRVLRDVALELVSGPASGQFTPAHRRYFARAFCDQGVMARDQAIALGLSSTADAEVDDPMQRQEACLLIAAFLRHVGDLAGTRSWAQRASEVSAGAGSHKDYHMAQVASWLVRSIHRAGPDELLTLDRLARAIEVAGGRGGFDGATDELQLLLRLEPARACRLAFEWIDRQVLNIAGVVAALTAGGAAAGAGGILLSAIYCELYSLIAHGDTSKVALAVLSAFPNEHKREVAVRLMASARVNGLPSHRAEVARSLEGALREEGLGELVLTGGLGPGEDDSARQSTLYRTAAGEVETLEQVAARLGDQEHPEAWNPNPDGNTGFEWWAAIRKAKVRNLAHLDTLVARFPPPDYRKVELFADKAELLLESGDRNAAREFAEQAISVARDGSWHRWFDGAQKRTGYGALKKVDRTAGASRARDQFAKDLAAGKLHNSYLLSDIGETLELMEIDWPADAARAAVNDYLEQVLLGNQHVPPYDALSGSSPAWSTDEALCRFIAHFAAFPVVEVAVSARRVLAQYVAGGGKGLTALLADAREWDPVQLEHILAAVHVGSRSHASSLGELRTWIEGLNASESLGLRSIAKRICDEQRWDWRDITTQPNQPVILLTRSDDNEREIPMLVDGDVTVAWRLYRVLFAPLEEAGLDRQELRSEFERVYRALEKAYVWTDDERMKRWMKMLSARFWLHPRAILGREAAMRVFGRRSLSGQVSPGAEVAYDQLYPIYDPALEVTQPTERPAELRGLDWRIAGGEREAWLDGACAETWDDYPDSVLGLRIVGERTWLIRPEWEWPREERYRGLVAGAPSQATGRRSLNSAYELTYEMYLSGRGQDEQQLIVLNDERQLSGSAYKWAAINPSFARALGWRPSEDAPFQWLDSSSNVMVTSTYWRDGWVWLEPPRFESLGEGWFVSATPAAIEAMRRLAPEASVHLWVERHSHGERPYAGKWHLSKPL